MTMTMEKITSIVRTKAQNLSRKNGEPTVIFTDKKNPDGLQMLAKISQYRSCSNKENIKVVCVIDENGHYVDNVE